MTSLHELWWQIFYSQCGSNIDRILECNDANSHFPDSPLGKVYLIVPTEKNENEVWTSEFIALLKLAKIPNEVLSSSNSDTCQARRKELAEFSKRKNISKIWDMYVFLGFSEEIRLEAISEMPHLERSYLALPTGLSAAVLNKIPPNIKNRCIFTSLINKENLSCASGTQLFNEIYSMLRISYDKHSSSISRFEKIIILVHGIKTRGFWQFRLKAHLEEIGFKVHNVDYNYFSLLKFLNPFSWRRQRAKNKVQMKIDNYLDPTNGEESSKFFLVGHSFGTLLISRCLENISGKVAGVIFCGSIAHKDSSEALLKATDGDLINEIGAKDYWPAIARSNLYGYGSVGFDGFKDDARIKDRLHRNINHSGFLNVDFADKNWVPYFDGDQHLTSGDEHAEPGFLKKTLHLIPLEIILFLPLVLIFSAIYSFFGLVIALVAFMSVVVLLMVI